jgi:hypothetical protein
LYEGSRALQEAQVGREGENQTPDYIELRNRMAKCALKREAALRQAGTAGQAFRTAEFPEML